MEDLNSELQLHEDVLFVVKKVSELRNHSVSEIIGRSLNREISVTRKLAVFVARNSFDYSTTKLGKMFGDRDHTFVVRACQEVDSWKRKFSKVRDMVNELEMSCLYKQQSLPARFKMESL